METGILNQLYKRNFLPFFITQFLGAFNDNAFKLTMLTMISYDIAHIQTQSEFYQVLASILFILPFFLLSATSGQLADKYDKAILIRVIKCVEVFLMIIGSLALYQRSVFWMMCTLMGLGIHSTFFGPIKYAILPDLLPKNNLLAATGLVDAGTFIAILLGVIMGVLITNTNNSTPFLAIFMLVFVALIGLLTSLFIPAAPSSLPELKVDLRIWRANRTLLKDSIKHPGMFLAILGISWFWLIGSVIMTKLPDYTRYVLGADTNVFALFLALFSIGIASGSIIVNIIFRGRINLALVPYAMLGYTWFCFDLYWASPVDSTQVPLETINTFFMYFFHWRIAFDLLMLAFCCGFFVVPLYTYLEVTSSAGERARTIAANNIYNSLFMVLGAIFVMVFLHYQATIPQVFLIISILNSIAAGLAWVNLKRIN